MNTLNICLIAAVLVGLATGAEVSHQLSSKVERTPTTIWEEFSGELQNATRGTQQFMKYGVKAAVETLKSTVQNEIEILYRLNNVEAVTVRSALQTIANLIGKVEENISTMEASFEYDENIPNEKTIKTSRLLSTARSTDGMEDLMKRIQLLDALLDMLGKIMDTISPPPNTTTPVTETTSTTTKPPTASSTAGSTIHNTTPIPTRTTASKGTTAKYSI